MHILFAVAQTHFARIFPSEIAHRIRAAGTVIDAPVPVEVDEEFLERYIGDADVLITGWGTPVVNEAVSKAAPGLSLIAHAAGSVKHHFTDVVSRRGIRVTGAASAIAGGVAEYCLGLIVTTSKRVYWLADDSRRGFWSRERDYFGPSFEIFRQNVGIIGASFVGRRLCELLQPMSCNVMIYDPYCSAERARELGATKVETLEALFSQCRVVSLNAPTTDETIGMIRGSHFALLRPGSVFINTARAIIVNQEEMVAELEKGKFVACLDVTAPEPPPIDGRLRTLPNVILTPHIAGAVAENLMRIGEFIAGEIEAYAEGRPLSGEVTADQLSTIA